MRNRRVVLSRVVADTRVMATRSASTSDRTTGLQWRRRLPGIALCLAAAGVSYAFTRLVPVVSPLLVAILLGVALAAFRPVPTAMKDGVTFSGKQLLRAGIVLLGLQLSLRQIIDLGFGTLALVVTVVVAGLAGTMVMGSWLGLGWTQRLLIACGFSICGAAAVAGVDGTVDADEEEVATAIALVVVFGTLMIGVIPLLVALLGLGDETGGLWAGASIHEVAQVVAAGGIIGGGALGVAVLVKLARVLMLAPVLVWVGWRQRSRMAQADDQDGTLPPLVPLFVIGFLAMVLVNSWVPVPTWLLDVGRTAQTVLLAAAMFALGCGVRIADLRRAGSAPVVLAAVSTLWVSSIALVGSLILT